MGLPAHVWMNRQGWDKKQQLCYMELWSVTMFKFWKIAPASNTSADMQHWVQHQLCLPFTTRLLRQVWLPLDCYVYNLSAMSYATCLAMAKPSLKHTLEMQRMPSACSLTILCSCFWIIAPISSSLQSTTMPCARFYGSHFVEAVLCKLWCLWLIKLLDSLWCEVARVQSHGPLSNCRAI